MASYSSILAWEIPWTEESGGPQSMGSQRGRHYLATKQQWLKKKKKKVTGLSLTRKYTQKFAYNIGRDVPDTRLNTEFWLYCYWMCGEIRVSLFKLRAHLIRIWAMVYNIWVGFFNFFKLSLLIWKMGIIIPTFFIRSWCGSYEQCKYSYFVTYRAKNVIII